LGAGLRLSDERAALVDGGRRLAARGLVIGSSGNLSIRKDDLTRQDMYGEDVELTRLVESTDGGVIVIGLSYDRRDAVRVFNQVCPECGSTDAHLLGPADEHVAAGLRAEASLYQCADCGTAWDA